MGLTRAFITMASYFYSTTQCQGIYLDYLVPGGNKYRNLALQVGGVSKMETLNYAQAALAMPGKN
jgi:hypothetical protein